MELPNKLLILAGARWMRERAAKACEETYPELRGRELVQLPCFDSPAECAAAIRALPLGEEA